MEHLALLGSKLDKLLKSYNTVMADNERLRATIDGQNKVIQRLTKKVQDMEASGLGIQPLIVVQEDEKAQVQQQLDELIQEIDQILITLND
jgi:uncharacterized ferritin-like protein (DUF455 family)